MPDCDWVKYKQLRGQPLPETISFQGQQYRQTKLFKRDFYAVTGLFELQPGPDAAASTSTAPHQIVVKIYHLDRWGLIPLRWMGRWLWRREMHFGKALVGVAGVAQVVGRVGKSGIVREYVPGQNLREFMSEHQPNEKFFPILRESLAGIHDKDIIHNDLSKPENVLVRDDGSPVLIDFQIALQFPHPPSLIGYFFRPFQRYMQSVDRYHLLKHHRRLRPEDFTPEEMKEAYKKSWLLRFHARFIRRPYRWVRHLILDNFMRAQPEQQQVNQEELKKAA